VQVKRAADLHYSGAGWEVAQDPTVTTYEVLGLPKTWIRPLRHNWDRLSGVNRGNSSPKGIVLCKEELVTGPVVRDFCAGITSAS